MHQHVLSSHFFVSLRQAFRLKPRLDGGHITGLHIARQSEVVEEVQRTLCDKLGRQICRKKMHKEKSNGTQRQPASRYKANKLFTQSVWQGMTVLFCCFWLSANLCAEEYMSQQAFLQKAFSDKKYEPQMVWLDTEAKAIAEKILGHRYQGLRIRYWQAENKTAWILNEIGKERPIRIGLVIDGDAIETVDILAFEESRGWEVRYPFFTEQFAGVGLVKEYRLDKNIDGITGATLSVRAVTNTSRLALYLHRKVLHKTLAENP